MTSDILFTAINQMRPPVEMNIVDIVCDVLEYETNAQGRVHYQLLFKTDLTKLVEKYWSGVVKTSKECETLISDSDQDKDSDKNTSSTVTTCAMPSASSQYQSTMDGDIGKLSEEFKQESLRQFNELMRYCQEHGIELNRNLAERGTCAMM